MTSKSILSQQRARIIDSYQQAIEMVLPT